jgi:hypothetical protein
LTTVHCLLLQQLLRFLCTLHINEVGVGEASGLPAAAIDSDADVQNVLDLLEQICRLALASCANERDGIKGLYHSNRGRSSGTTCSQ